MFFSVFIMSFYVENVNVYHFHSVLFVWFLTLNPGIIPHMQSSIHMNILNLSYADYLCSDISCMPSPADKHWWFQNCFTYAVFWSPMFTARSTGSSMMQCGLSCLPLHKEPLYHNCNHFQAFFKSRNNRTQYCMVRSQKQS